MTESWEEKTERLEREYQARIDRLRKELDCGQDGPCAKSPGCNRHWEERSRELMQEVRDLQSQLAAKNKRVAELEEQLVHYDSQATAVRVALSTAGIPESEPYPDEPGLSEHERSLRAGGWMLKAPERIGRLAKRVPELERCMQEVGLLAFMRDATPGDITAHMTRVMDSYVQRIADLQSQLAWTPVSAGLPTEPGHYEFVSNGVVLHVGLADNGSWFSPDGIWIEPSICSHYRRIELPKDGAT